MIRQVSILTAVFVLVFSVAVEAKNLYVDGAIGNDSVSYEANSSSNPWRTIGRAAWGSTSRSAPNTSQAARAGDTVIVRAGTYSTTGTGSRLEPAYNPVNSGTSGAPIVFRADGTVVLTQTGTGPSLGANGKNYITWKGFTVNEINALGASDTGPAVLWLTTGSSIEDSIIDGYDAGAMGSNHCGIRLENATNCLVRNNKISNVLNYGSFHMNGAGIMDYNGINNIIEHNEIYNCGAGIYIKAGNHQGYIIRYNYIYGCQFQIAFQNSHPSLGTPLIYQNIIRCTPNGAPPEDYGIWIRYNSYRVKVVNNTIVNCNRNAGLATSQTVGTVMHNNIVYQTQGHVLSAWELTSADEISADYNNYYTSNAWSIAGRSYASLSSWRTALGGCPGSGNECNSITSNPLFVNENAAVYRLQTGSPARMLGRDILNLTGGGTSTIIPAGAYITGNEIIGRTGGAMPPLPPSAPPPGGTISPPTGLRIQ